MMVCALLRFWMGALVAVWFLGTAVAQDVSYKLTYADPLFALANGAQVGDELKPCSSLTGIGAAKVRLSVTNVTATPKSYAAGAAMICFDRAVASSTNYSSFDTYFAAAQEKVVTGASWVPAKGLPGVNNAGDLISVDTSILGVTSYSGSYAAGTSLRPVGIWHSFVFGPGQSVLLAPGARIELMEYTLNFNLIKLITFPCWGDDESESGIMLFGAGNVPFRSTYLGATSGTATLLASKKYSLTVSGTLSAFPDTYSGTEDTPLTVPAPGVLANDFPPAGFGAQLDTPPAHGTVVLNANGSFTYTPNKDFFGTDSYTYYLTNGVEASSIASVTLNIVNTPEETVINVPTELETEELNTVQFTATASNIDFPLGLFGYSLFNAPAGAWIGTFNGQFSWTPSEKQGPGEYIFEVRALGNWSGATVARKLVRIRVQESNSAPNLEQISTQIIDEKRLFTIQVVATDSDEPEQTLTFNLLQGPPGMTLSSSGRLEWTPTESQGPGTYNVQIQVSDNAPSALTDTETFTVIVREVNSPPVIESIPPQVIESGSELIYQIIATDADLPIQSLTYSAAGPVPAGLTVSASGRVMWTPTLEQVPATYFVKVRASDSVGGFDEKVMEIRAKAKRNVSGKVFFTDFVGERPTEVLMQFRTPGTMTVVFEAQVPVASNGSYEVRAPDGDLYDLTMKVSTWLRRTLQIDLRPGDLANANFRLINGDANGDNYVGTDDYLIINQSFDLSLGDAGFDPRADLDGDGYVGVEDYLILNNAFDVAGDE